MKSVQLDLSFSSVYGHAPEIVWAAMTDREALCTWFLETDFEAQVGKTFYVKGPHIGMVHCTVVALDPPRRMEWSWQSPGLLAPTTVVFTLEAIAEGTRLRVRHIGSTSRSHQKDITEGWPGRLTRLQRWLDGALITAPPADIVAGNAEVRRMTAIAVSTTDREQILDLTEQVASRVKSLNHGVCHLFTRHTTCALTILTDEEGIAEDFLTVLRGLVPQTTAYVHDSADHVRAHVLSALIGPSLSVPVRDGRLSLGQFQRIVLLEFEGPRERAIELLNYRPAHD